MPSLNDRLRANAQPDEREALWLASFAPSAVRLAERLRLRRLARAILCAQVVILRAVHRNVDERAGRAK